MPEMNGKLKQPPYDIHHEWGCIEYCLGGGREPPDTMSLRCADMSLLDLLGRLILRYAVNEPLL